MEIKEQLGDYYNNLDKKGQEPGQNQWILDNIKMV